MREGKYILMHAEESFANTLHLCMIFQKPLANQVQKEASLTCSGIPSKDLKQISCLMAKCEKHFLYREMARVLVFCQRPWMI